MDAIKADNKSVLGVHIEGPFFDLSRRGAHKESYIRKIEQADINWLIDSVTKKRLQIYDHTGARTCAARANKTIGIRRCIGLRGAYQCAV